MFWSEDVGIISNSKYPYDKFWWTLPNCFASFVAEYYHESDNRSTPVVCSPWFSSYGTKWRLSLIRYADKRYQCDYCGIFLWKIPSSDFCQELTVKLRLLNDDITDRQIEGKLNSHGSFGKWDYIPISEFNEEAHNLSPDGFIRFVCEMRLATEKSLQIPAGESKDEENQNPEHNTDEEMSEVKGVDRLIQDLKNLLSNGQESDVTVKVEGREFKVHRNILTVRSPVFASMLKHDTKENATGVVDIPDCSAEAFEVFLAYIYTGNATNMSSENIFNLYYAADKYQVNDLKSECKEYLEENLSVENFCAVMTLSLQHSETGLQKKAIRFFCENVKVIVKTVQWQLYVKDYPVQANELYIKAINA